MYLCKNDEFIRLFPQWEWYEKNSGANLKIQIWNMD